MGWEEVDGSIEQGYSGGGEGEGRTQGEEGKSFTADRIDVLILGKSVSCTVPAKVYSILVD